MKLPIEPENQPLTLGEWVWVGVCILVIAVAVMWLGVLL
jgi:hypothetical protein